MSAKLNINPFEFKNPRPESVLGYERDNYEFLCRESFKVFYTLKLAKQKIIFKKKILWSKLPEYRLKNLKCRYINYSPLLYIAPVKEELLFDDPPIWVYHDVITEKQIELMKILGAPKVKSTKF